MIGSLNGASPALLDKLSLAGAVCTGSVEDLTTVLRPGDIHIIPWEHDTGTRTRIPLVMNYAQVLVSTRAAAACIAELVPGKNCILVENLKEMAGQIVGLYSQPEIRKELGLAGRQTFEEHFTREALQPDFDRFLQAILSRST